ncbi:tetratricopeptide repeat protein [Bacteroidota bacterium]
MFNRIALALILISVQLIAQSNNEIITVSDIDVQKAVNHYEKEEYEKAITILENILDENEDNAEAYFVLSKTLFKMNELDDAIDAAEEAVELNDKREDFHYHLAQLYMIDIQDASIFRQPSLASGMKEELIATLELNPNHIDALTSLANFYLRAPGITGGDNELALQQALKLKFLDAERGLTLLSQIYIELENYPEARTAANELINFNEYNARRVLARLCQVQNDDAGREEQYKTIEAKFGEDPECSGFYNDYGYYLMGKNRLDKAIEKFKKQVLLAPGDANAHDSLGEGYLNKGMLKESLAEYKKALKINPEFENALEKVEEIEDLLDE